MDNFERMPVDKVVDKSKVIHKVFWSGFGRPWPSRFPLPAVLLYAYIIASLEKRSTRKLQKKIKKSANGALT